MSRFALLPEYTTPRHEATSCNWELFEEVLPFGAHRASRAAGQPRHLRARRHPRRHRRARDARLPHAAVHLVAESRISNRCGPNARRRGRPAGQRHRVCRSTAGAARRRTCRARASGRCPTTRFRSAVASREPFWTTLARDGERFRVYLMNDRGGIYALGYPSITWFGHLVNLAELVVLAGALYVVLLSRRGALRAHRRDHSGERSRAPARVPLELLPQAVPRVRRAAPSCRSSILAFAVRTYFAAQARAGVEDAAARTATVAQRLVEDYATLQQRGPGGAGGDRRSDHGARQPRHRSGREPVRPVEPRGDEPARSVRVAAALAADAEPRLSPHRARSAADLRRASSSSPTRPTWRPRRRSGPADATASSPCRCRCGSWRSSGRSTSSIAR